MIYTIDINTENPNAKAFLNFLKNLDFVSITKKETKKTTLEKTQLNSEQQKFKKMLFEGLDELKTFREEEQKRLKTK